MLKRAWNDFAGLIAGWWEEREDDWLGTLADRVLAMLIVSICAGAIFTAGVILFALVGHPVVIACIAGACAGVYALTSVIARFGKKVNAEKAAERDRYIAEMLNDNNKHEKITYEQESE